MDTTTVAKTKTKHPQWTEQYSVTDDRIIDAYLEGKKDMAAFILSAIHEQKTQQLETAKVSLASLYNRISEISKAPYFVVLKSNVSGLFEAAIVVDNDDYNGDGFLQCYQEAANLEQEILKTNGFELRVLFVPTIIDIEQIKENLSSYQFIYGD